MAHACNNDVMSNEPAGSAELPPIAIDWEAELCKVAGNAFALMTVAQQLKVRLLAAQKAAILAGQRLEEANQAVHRVKCALQLERAAQKQAASTYACAKEQLNELQELTKALASKRQRVTQHEGAPIANVASAASMDTDGASSEGNDGVSEAVLHSLNDTALDHPRVRRGKPNPPNWNQFANFSRSKYQKLEVEEQDRRAVPLNDDPKSSFNLARGDDERGWFSHWRRGVGPTLRGWAKGSRGAIVHMLAEAAHRFDVVAALGDALGLQSNDLGERTKTCVYICDRIGQAISFLKKCPTAEVGCDYSVLLAAASPRPEDGMSTQVAKVLGVTTGYR